MVNDNQQRLELSWYNKDRALIPTESGKYGYTWVDPRDPRYCETRTLVMDEYVEGEQAPKVDGVVYSERADLEPTTDNLLILGESGDVLEALTRVPELRDKYVGKVKCIYIDPPFNTGEVFGDSYEDNLEHSIWLTMMRDRLDHLYSLLAREGSIWVHLDNKENHRMRLLLDSKFGPNNFVAEVVWQKAYSPKMDQGGFSASHDTILVYRKSHTFKPNAISGMKAKVAFPFSDDKGRYNTFPLRKWGHNSLREDAPGSWFPIESPDGTLVYPIRPDGRHGNWRWGREKIRRDAELIVWKKDRAGRLSPYVKQYEDVDSTRPPISWWPREEVGVNRDAKRHLQDLFADGEMFATPKPESLLERVLSIASDPGDIVLDCFVGSGTTAAVAHKMGRRWVVCELSSSNFARFTRPRLLQVVKGQDNGGITQTQGEGRMSPSDDALPEGMEPLQAFEICRGMKLASNAVETPLDLAKILASSIRAARKAGSEALLVEESKSLLDLLKKFQQSGLSTVDVLPLARKQVEAQLRTVPEPAVVHWRGGGGYQVAHLAPACFDYDPDLGMVTMTEAAQDPAVLRASVAAHFRFRLTPEHRYFHGVRGAMRLFVTRDPLTPEYVTSLAAHLEDRESLTIASTVVLDGAAEALRTARRGSLVVHIPSDLFAFDTKDKR